LYLHRREGGLRIMDIALLPGFRGRGVGGTILRALQAEAVVDGGGLSIHVEAFNPARRLYERLGFKPAAEAGVYILMEWSADSRSAVDREKTHELA
jgi:predicted GNAT family acetyltransferase